MRIMTLLMMPMMTAPMNTQNIEPTPPVKLVPPTMVAVMAVSYTHLDVYKRQAR